jgi:hypothetical protein
MNGKLQGHMGVRNYGLLKGTISACKPKTELPKRKKTLI